MRREVREQIDAVPDEIFDAEFPAWEKLPDDVRESKVILARDELLMMLDRAGYVVRKKVP